MNILGLHLDRPRAGSHFSDRMHRILGTCHSVGILWHEEKVTYREGVSAMHRMEDVRPQGSVLVTPQYEKYGLHVNPRVLPRLRGMAPQFAYALNVPSVAVEVDGDVVYVRVPREGGAGEGVVLFEQAWALAPDIAPGSLLLGIDEEQKQLVVDMGSPSNVHVGVIGMTGSGKSTLMKTMILSAEMAGQVKVALFDPSGGFQSLSGHPSVWRGGMFRRAEECERGLELLTRMIERDGDESAMTYVFVDEVPELVHQRPQIREYLGRLAQAGRHAGLHLILGAQHPLTSELGAATLRNIPLRLIGRVADKAAAYNAAGREGTDAQLLRGGGDFVAVNGSVKRHFQAAMPSTELLESWAHRYPPRPPRLSVTSQREILPGRAATIVQPAIAVAPATSGGAGGGRPFDDIPQEMIDWIAEIHAKHADSPTLRPSLNAIARESVSRYSVEWGRDKQHRARGYALGAAAHPDDLRAIQEAQQA